MKNSLVRFSVPVVTALGLLAINSPSAFAQASPALNATQTAKLAAVIAKGNTDIDARVVSLTALIAKVNATTKLSASQKSALVTEMQGEVTSLTALKAKLDADTDVAVARSDFNNIFAQHFIYAFYLPRVERIVAADAESDAIGTLNGLTATLQGYITQAKNSGNDVTALQTKLADMQAKTADASTQAQSVLSALLPLTASGYPANKATVQGASTTLKAGRSDLETARTDAKAIATSLKKMLNLK